MTRAEMPVTPGPDKRTADAVVKALAHIYDAAAWTWGEDAEPARLILDAAKRTADFAKGIEP